MPCPSCGDEQAADLQSCPKCSEKSERRARRPAQAPPREVPLGPKLPLKNPRALSAFRCGVYGLIPFVGLLLGPLAVLFGILGLRHVKSNPADKGASHAIAGIVLGAMELVANWLGLMFVLHGLATVIG